MSPWITFESYTRSSIASGESVFHTCRKSRELPPEGAEGDYFRIFLRDGTVSPPYNVVCCLSVNFDRAVEKENERINQEFRQSFAENITKMEDRLTHFVQDHTKFLGDLSANYGKFF